MGKRNKKKNKKQYKSWDKMTFEKREKRRAQLKKERVYTKAFSTRQSFGAASDAISLDVEAYTKANPDILKK